MLQIKFGQQILHIKFIVSMVFLKRKHSIIIDTTGLKEYIDIVKDWLLFYNTVRIKNRDYI
jgi:hypothetical protein